MALTVTRIDVDTFGNRLARILSIAYDASYPSGGYAFGQVFTGMAKVFWADTAPLYDGAAQPAHVFIGVLDIANALLRVFGSPAAAAQSTPLLEVAAATSLSAYTSRLLVIGY